MEKKSDDDKCQKAVDKKEKEKDLFRVPDNPANVILKFCDDRTLLNLLTVNKSWNKKINEFELQKRKEYLKYFLWYIYGCGNAERLCKIVDDVVNELNKNKDDIIMESENNNEDKKFLIWHMVLLDILNIKIDDLKLDFDLKKSESIEKAIKNYLLSNKSVKRRSNFVESAINSLNGNNDNDLSDDEYEYKYGCPQSLCLHGWIKGRYGKNIYEYIKQIFPELTAPQTEAWMKRNSYSSLLDIIPNEVKLLQRMLVCFFKVSFWQMEKVIYFGEYKNDGNTYKKYKKDVYGLKNYFYRARHLHGIWFVRNWHECMAVYLFKTGELENWFCQYKNDFLSYFCSDCDLVPNVNLGLNVYFREFVFCFNKIKPLQERYQENSGEFWQMFFINIVDKNSYNGLCVLECITPYIEDGSLKIKMKNEMEKITGCSDKQALIYNHQLFDSQLRDSGYFYRHLGENYFSSIIIRFCGKNDLSDKVVQSISKVIEDKDGVDCEIKVGTNMVINPVQNDMVGSNEINFVDEDQISNANNKSDKKNKAGVWSHFLFGLFFVLACLNLFLCFKISLYFLVLFFISLVGDLYLGFKNFSNANNKSDKKNKAGVWSHFLFGLFFVLACLNLFLCFKISLYFLILVAVFVACDLYLGFKNYGRCCQCSENMEIPLIDNNEIVLNRPQNMDDNSIKLENFDGRLE